MTGGGGGGGRLKDSDEGCNQLSSPLGALVGGTQEVELSGGQRPLDTPGQETGHVCVHVCVRLVILMDASY